LASRFSSKPVPYSPDYGDTYTTYCGKPLDGLKLIGTEQETNKTFRKCAKCVQAKFGDKPKRPFTVMSDAEVDALVLEREAKIAKLPATKGTMKPKLTIDPNAAGVEAQRLFAEDRTASAGLKDMRSAKTARKEQLKKEEGADYCVGGS
jgi:hypothetical protein